MKIYCLGFYFSKDMEHVILIDKTRPEWQAGRLNGVGGSVEREETPRQAMVREFREETGIQTMLIDWEWFAVMEDVNGIGAVHVFKAVKPLEVVPGEMSDEGKPSWYYVRDILTTSKPLHNLKWLIPLAQEDTLPVRAFYPNLFSTREEQLKT